MTEQHPASLVREAQRYVNKVAKVLQLWEWEITVQREFADEGAAAQTNANERIHFAWIRLGKAWPTYGEKYRRQTLVHEVLHIVTARIDHAVYRVTDVLPDGVQVLAEHSYEDSLEATIDRLAVALEPFIPV